ncbi:tRNA (adenosine(37)-N6)-threonylcarbamoyltransferase complex ATPase subunit type 1 TsaE [Candidatus Saccharibacteria bacterium]|nr:tRNA (adenosine(37)-N6)-threonylcarbamoyltransferase complex ATPase subunit type 1 TsaE [Candidatus Saccharibacteria bacterium]
MKIHSEKEMLDFGKSFAKKLKSSPNHAKATVIELIGDVGVGKTTFTRGLAEGLGVKEPVTSPSFTISKSYALPSNGNLIHYDFYRLNDPGLMQEDLAENLQNPKNIIIIEWGNSISNLLPPKHLTIIINYDDQGNRDIIST